MIRARQSLDVLVIGAGPAGIAAASELDRRGARTAVVNLHRTTQPQFEALAPQVRARLRSLGLECALASGTPCVGVRGQWASPVDRSYLFEPHGDGIAIDRNQFARDLRRSATRAGVPLFDVDRPPKPIRDGTGWHLEITGRNRQHIRMTASWLVDATGRAAATARTVGAIRQQEDRVVAIVGLLATGRRKNPLTLIEARSEGWWYGVPAGQQRVFIGLVTDIEHSRRYRAKRYWLDLLNQTDTMASAVGGQPLLVDSLRVIAASNVCRVPPCGSGWMAIGDAAAAHDPLDGAGVLRALDSGIAAAAALAGAASGRPEDLAVYAQRSLARFAAHTAASSGYLERLAGRRLGQASTPVAHPPTRRGRNNQRRAAVHQRGAGPLHSYDDYTGLT